MVVLLNGITYLLRQVSCAPVIHRLPLCLVAPAPVALSPWHAPSDTTIKSLVSGTKCSRRLADLSCAHYLVQPNKSFKPTLLRGSSRVHTLR